MISALTFIYFLCAALLGAYAFGTCVLLILALLPRRRPPDPPPLVGFPPVVVQLPFYNEPAVAARLIDAAARLDYPNLLIQILDDSTDATAQICAERAAHWRGCGVQIVHIRRETRQGYKAGALAHGLALAPPQTAYAAIFDADFVPPPDFLRRTIPFLHADPQMGALQTRWTHLNADANCLTAAQALALDAHFLIEQVGRANGGLLTNFSGSGGIWRIAAIHDAGGWSDATLTEDLDLSYRAQLRGWRIGFLPDVQAAGEIPETISAYRAQQRRWARGNIRCLIRLLPALWRAPRLTLAQRIMGTLHLGQYLTAPLMIALLLLSPPLLLVDGLLPELSWLGAFGLGALLTPIAAGGRRGLSAHAALLLLGTGMAWNNTKAVLGELFGRRIAFERTPKGGVRGAPARLAWAEALLSLYALIGAGIAARTAPPLALYLAVYAAGFAAVVGWSGADAKIRVKFKS
jgi:cellulose synthase/poly-beta-1,6-N-acetylglucosamine synthase-like glycosyltransferase